MNAIVTLCVGEKFKALGNLTIPFIRSYAKRVNADFHVIEAHPLDGPVCYEKFQIKDYLKTYDRIQYFDLDILVKPSCPNLFDIVPPGMFGAFPEGEFLPRRNALEQAITQFGIDKTARHYDYFNAGMFICSKEHQPVFTLPEVLHNNFEDQTWMNLQVMKHTDLFRLPIQFNHMPSMAWDLRMNSHVIHYAGGALSFLPEDIAKVK